MTVVYTGESASGIYLSALHDILDNGEECAPRGKRIKEIRPAVIEFLDPRDRVTYLRGRIINPFFQLAEALWILSGRADVKWLETYNSNMANFSDDGVFFNAPYGERLRNWGRNSYRAISPNATLDQLLDVHNKILFDPDTRQAVASIFNPSFDSSAYTVDKKGKDMPCNLLLMFKLRNNKLDMSVANRSNDLHWGTFGANLCQFTTILETVASWLGVEMGVYRVFTDSLHVYLDDYGAAETKKILSNDQSNLVCPMTHSEPRMNSNYHSFTRQLKDYWINLDPSVHRGEGWVFGAISNWISDPYLLMTVQAMTAYVYHKKGKKTMLYNALHSMTDSTWKVSCLRFLSKKYGADQGFKDIYELYNNDVIDYINRAGEV